jgi:SPP1 gp7 family putative phage head morphogenesis protein
LHLHNLYNTGCGSANCNTKQVGSWQLADGKGKGFDKKIFDKASKHLHEKGTVKPAIVNDKPVKDLIKETNRILNDALNFGIADNVIPPTMLKALQDDVYLFSGMKTYAKLKTASALLLDELGKRKPFSQFAADVEKVHKNYNQTYLEAEYYFATSSAQMAANWAALDDTGRYNLQYRTAGDARVRDSHNALRDTILPPDDAFWQSYYPPNGWRCRCTAVEVSKQRYKESDSKDAIAKGDKATTAIGKDGKNSLAIFRFNPGLQKIIFPPTHPYKGDLTKCGLGKLADGSGQDEKCKVATEVEKQIKGNEDLKIRRKQLQDEAKLTLKDVQVQHQDIEEPITFTTKGIKEYLNQPHKHYEAKNELIATMPKVLKGSTYKGFGDSTKSDGITKVHVFEIEILKDKSYLIVRENTDNVLQFYSISDSDKVLNYIKK